MKASAREIERRILVNAFALESSELDGIHRGVMLSSVLECLEVLADEIPELPALKRRLDDCLSFMLLAVADGSSRLQAAQDDGRSPEAAAAEFGRAQAARIQRRLEALRPGEALLLPAGYHAAGQTHAMLWELVRESDERFSLSIYNTNASADLRHPAGTATEKVVVRNELEALLGRPIDPLLIQTSYRRAGLPRERLLGDVGCEVFARLVLLHDDPRALLGLGPPTGGAEAKLGNYLLAERLGGEEAVPSGERRDYRTRQKSGNCAFESLMAYLRDHLGPDVYHRLKERLLREVLRRFRAKLRAEAPEDGALIARAEHRLAQAGAKRRFWAEHGDVRDDPRHREALGAPARQLPLYRLLSQVMTAGGAGRLQG